MYNSLSYISNICSYFESVFVENNLVFYLTIVPMMCLYFVYILSISLEQRKSEVVEIDLNTSGDYDNFPVVFLIVCAIELSFPLSFISNKSIDQGEYPSILKFNNIIRIYKLEGDKSQVEPYHPLSNQPVISKLFERIEYRTLRRHIEQFRYEEPHSLTSTNLLLRIHHVTKTIYVFQLR